MFTVPGNWGYPHDESESPSSAIRELWHPQELQFGLGRSEGPGCQQGQGGAASTTVGCLLSSMWDIYAVI